MQVQPYLFFDGRCEEAVVLRRMAGSQGERTMRFMLLMIPKGYEKAAPRDARRPGGGRDDEVQ